MTRCMNTNWCIIEGGVDACHLAVELEIDLPNTVTGLCTSNSVLL